MDLEDYGNFLVEETEFVEEISAIQSLEPGDVKRAVGAINPDYFEVLKKIRDGADLESLWYGPETINDLNYLDSAGLIDRPLTGRNLRLSYLGKKYFEYRPNMRG